MNHFQTKQCDRPKCKKRIENTDPPYYTFGQLIDNYGRQYVICGECVVEIIGEEVMPAEPAKEQPE